MCVLLKLTRVCIKGIWDKFAEIITLLKLLRQSYGLPCSSIQCLIKITPGAALVDFKGAVARAQIEIIILHFCLVLFIARNCYWQLSVPSVAMCTVGPPCWSLLRAPGSSAPALLTSEVKRNARHTHTRKCNVIGSTSMRTENYKVASCQTI